MKTHLLLLLNTCILSVILCSCEYENSDIYEPKVNKNINPPDIQTVNLELSEDTLYLYASREVQFKFQSNDIQKIVAVKFYLDNTLLVNVNKEEGYFYLNYEQLNKGVHKLKIEIFTKTGTGSIADILGNEVFEFNSNKEWVIKVESYNYNNKIQISEQNGLLKLSWPQNNSGNFKSFIVGLSNKTINTINNEIIDSAYFGQGMTLNVYAKTQDGKNLLWASTTLERNLPQLSLEVSNENVYKMVWGKSKYYNAIKTYELYENSDLLKTTEDYTDTSYTITNKLFGDHITLNLRFTPKFFPWLRPSSSFGNYLGFRYASNKDRQVSIIKGINNNEFIYINDSIIKYSLESKKTLQKIGYQKQNSNCSEAPFVGCEVSPSGNYISASSGCDDVDILINSSTLSIVSSQNLEYLRNQYPLSISISDIGVGIVNSNSNGFYLYDFINKSVVTHYVSGKGLQISSNGDYILLDDGSLRLVQFTNSQFRAIWTKPSNINNRFFEFSATEPNQLALWDGSIFSIRQCSNFLPIYEFPLVNEVIVDIDFSNNELLTRTTGHLLIRNLQNGNLIKDILTNSPYSFSCCLFNHHVISDNGIIYFAY